jgi:hypothetical protein
VLEEWVACVVHAVLEQRNGDLQALVEAALDRELASHSVGDQDRSW